MLELFTQVIAVLGIVMTVILARLHYNQIWQTSRWHCYASMQYRRLMVWRSLAIGEHGEKFQQTATGAVPDVPQILIDEMAQDDLVTMLQPGLLPHSPIDKFIGPNGDFSIPSRYMLEPSQQPCSAPGG